MKRRVVVTGLGIISPIGNDIDTFWENVKKGTVGIGEITKFDTTDFKVKLAAEVKDFDWGFDSNAVENHVEVYVGFLRKKLAAIGSNVCIEAVRRLGYHLEVDETC